MTGSSSNLQLRHKLRAEHAVLSRSAGAGSYSLLVRNSVFDLTRARGLANKLNACNNLSGILYEYSGFTRPSLIATSLEVLMIESLP